MSTADDTLLKFPCEFSVKAMGRSAPDFETLVADIVERHVPAPGLLEGSVRSRCSRGGKYLAVTVTFTATSKHQLDAIYQALTDHKRVLISL